MKRLAGVFYGWWMIALGSGIRSLGGGLHIYGFTVFFLPLSQDLGVNRAATSLAFSLARAEGAIEGPVAGYLIDRLGPRPVILFGVTLTGIGYMLMSLVDSYATFLVVYLGLISLSFGAGFMHSPMILANSWFIRRRSMAMSLISGSTAVGGAIIAPLLAAGVQAWGWRATAFAAGLLLILLGLPLGFWVRGSPESMGLKPDGAPPPRPEEARAARDEEPIDFRVKQAMATVAFWQITLATLLRVGGLSAILVHFIPLLVWKGLTEQRAALLLGALAFLSVPTHVFLGWLADRVSKPRLMGASMLVATAAVFVLIYGESEPYFWLFVLLFPVVESIFPISWATVGDFFGRRYFGTIRGTMGLFQTWGSVVAPVAAGALYDRTESYEALLWGLVVVFLVAALLYASLPKPRLK